jgi:hypothetical protein
MQWIYILTQNHLNHLKPSAWYLSKSNVHLTKFRYDFFMVEKKIGLEQKKTMQNY